MFVIAPNTIEEAVGITSKITIASGDAFFLELANAANGFIGSVHMFMDNKQNITSKRPRMPRPAALGVNDIQAFV